MSENYIFIRYFLKENKNLCSFRKDTGLPNSDTQTGEGESSSNTESSTMSWFPVLRGTREARRISISPSGQQVRLGTGSGVEWRGENREDQHGPALGLCPGGPFP